MQACGLQTNRHAVKRAEKVATPYQPKQDDIELFLILAAPVRVGLQRRLVQYRGFSPVTRSTGTLQTLICTHEPAAT